MKEYFIIENETQVGPFTFEQLREKGISKSTPVWREGIADWIEAGSISELEALFSQGQPPVYQKASQDNNTSSRVKQSKWWIWIIVVLSIGIGITVILTYMGDKKRNTNARINTYQSHEQTKFSLEQQEKENPMAFLDVNIGNSTKDILTGQFIVPCAITNNATIAAYKDFEFEAEFFSKTKTTLGKKDIIVYKRIEAGKTIKFNISIDRESKTEKTCVCTFVGASAE